MDRPRTRRFCARVWYLQPSGRSHIPPCEQARRVFVLKEGWWLVYPRETPPHTRTARAQPPAAQPAPPPQTRRTVPQRANPTQTAYARLLEGAVLFTSYSINESLYSMYLPIYLYRQVDRKMNTYRHTRIYTHIYMHIHVYIYTYMYVCMYTYI